MSDGTNKFKDLFCDEATDQLATLSSELLNIEKDPENLERYATLMRAAHTIKGASATMGYSGMAKLSHVLEDVFHLGERKAIILNPSAVSVALHAVDQLRISLDNIKNNNTEIAVDDEIIALLEFTKQEKIQPEIASSAVMPIKNNPVQDFASVLPTTVRVDVERLDSLMGVFEEMLMLRLKLDSLLEPAIGIAKNISDQKIKDQLYFLKEFETIFSQLARLLSDTQSQLLVIRLVSIEMIFSQFPRMVRDLSLRENKKVEFNMEGGEVELDRTVLSGLGGALAHLLRNAIDHGIEESGIITLSAVRMNDRVHVSVLDNGVGINYDRVKQVAIERNIISSEAATHLRKQEINELLFHPNMSTNTEVTDISGRGVGLSAVQSFAKEVGGHVVVVSPAIQNKGTKFTLDLPVSLATVKVLLVESSRFTFALPFNTVIRTVVISRNTISQSAHQEMVEIDGALIPLLYLNVLLDITFADMFFAKRIKEKEEILAVLLEIDNERFLIVIDNCLGEQELLIKSLPPVLRNIRGFSGSALLPDGRTILLLDAHGLLLEALGDILGTSKQ